MSNFRRKNSYYRIEVSLADKMKLSRFIAAELQYLNAVLIGFAGPVRSMSTTITALTGRWEQLFGDVAATRKHPRDMTAATLDETFEKYRDLLFPNGTLATDEKQNLIFDIATAVGHIHPDVRRGIAVAMLREARDQAQAFSAKDGEGQFIQTITPIESRNKRHVQLSKGAVTSVIKDDHLAIKIPYMATPIIVPAPQQTWNYIFVRQELDGGHSLELSYESSPYNIRKMDASGLRKKAAKVSKVMGLTRANPV